MTLAEGIRNAVRRLEASWRLTRQTEAFHLEQDEIRHDLETLARAAEGAVACETIGERRVG